MFAALYWSCLDFFNYNEAPALAAEAPASYPAEALELAVITPPMATNKILNRNTKQLHYGWPFYIQEILLIIKKDKKRQALEYKQFKPLKKIKINHPQTLLIWGVDFLVVTWQYLLPRLTLMGLILPLPPPKGDFLPACGNV